MRPVKPRLDVDGTWPQVSRFVDIPSPCPVAIRWKLSRGYGVAALVWAGFALGMGCVPAGAAAPALQTASPPPSPAVRRIDEQMPAPARARGTAMVLENDGCETCHQETARQWRQSLHRQAHVDPVYARAFAREPMSFCQGCHAPEADPAGQVTAELGAMGVGCVTCHLTGDAVVAAPWRGPGAPPIAPHPIIRSERFASAEACVSCHEFDFPDGALRGGRLAMQSTGQEHVRSPQRETPCAGCHMPRDEAGHRTHDFAIAGAPDKVRAAIAVAALRLGETRIRLVLSPREVGHAFPTGDLFRRVEITAEALGDDNMVLAQQTRYLSRHFRRELRRSGIALAMLESDDRIGIDGQDTVVELELGEAARGRPIAYRIAYQRVEHPLTFRTDDAVVADEVVLGQGRLSNERGLEDEGMR